MLVNGITETFNFNSWPYDQFRSFYPGTEIDVDWIHDNRDHDEEVVYFIEYVGLLGDAYSIIADNTLLTGGEVGTLPTITIETVRAYSQERPLYSPVPFDFLSTGSDLPVLNLKVNDIPAYCEDCTYSMDAALNPTLSSATWTDNTLAGGITVPSSSRRLLQGTVTFPNDV